MRLPGELVSRCHDLAAVGAWHPRLGSRGPAGERRPPTAHDVAAHALAIGLDALAAEIHAARREARGR